jgi:hypothetical protein
MYRLYLGVRFALWCGLLALAQGCGDAADGSGDPIDSGIDSGIGDPNGFAAIYEDILLPSCAAVICHGTGTGELDMSTRARAYESMVEVPAAGDACRDMGFVRVVPGDAAGSLLVTKLVLDAAPCGETMPFGGVLLDADVARIAAWIDAGAFYE